jgi:RNA recognition motif-containing protein
VATLFMVNVPHDCTDNELTEWVQSSGFGVKSVRVIRDMVAGVSPAFAYVDIEETSVNTAVQTLNGKNIRERVILVSKAGRGRSAVA